MLHDGGFSAGQIAYGPVADPGVLKIDARCLCTTELTTRLLDVRAIRLGAAGSVARMTHSPPVFVEAHPVFRILFGQIQREFERLMRVAGKVQKRQKATRFVFSRRTVFPFSLTLRKSVVNQVEIVVNASACGI